MSTRKRRCRYELKADIQRFTGLCLRAREVIVGLSQGQEDAESVVALLTDIDAAFKQERAT